MNSCPDLMRRKFFTWAHLVMQSKFIHHGFCRFVHTQQIDLDLIAFELENHFVQGTHSRNIPKMSETDVDSDLVNLFLEVE